jgi:hypothetical protein
MRERSLLFPVGEKKNKCPNLSEKKQPHSTGNPGSNIKSKLRSPIEQMMSELFAKGNRS